MPTYTYACECGIYPLRVSISDRDSIPLCVKCLAKPRRLIDRPGMISKTGGGYAI